MEILLVLVVVTIGAMVQGLAGAGFGMVSVPTLVWYFGAIDGITWANLMAIIVAFSLLGANWDLVEWQKVFYLFLGAAPAIVLSVLYLKSIPEHILHLVLGTLMLLMVSISVFAFSFPPISGRISLTTTGFLAGTMSTAVAQSGPLMTAYAQASRWPQKSFAATMQPFFLLMNIVVIPSKLLLGLNQNMGRVLGWEFPVILSGILVGTLLVRFIKDVVSARSARKLAILVAFIGSILVILEGIGVL